ncbi:MAG: tyrosine-type recombinase/integrase [Lachnospiraceae bacterium]|nr:tyrosine-type recombinase/integrase [Lachnospiraceae bacterium]
MKSRKDSKGFALRKGETERKDGRYVYRYSEMGGGCLYAYSLTELREKEQELQKDLLDGLFVGKAKTTTLNMLFDESMKAKKNLRVSTIENYNLLWDKNIRDDFGKMKVTDIKKAHIERLYRDFEKRGMHKSTIKNYHLMIRAALDLAVENDLIRKNPAQGAKYDGEKDERQALTKDEQKSLVEFLETETIYNIYRPLITVFLGTGLRASELCGLTWKDIDFDKNEISVNHQLLKKKTAAADGKMLYIEKTKTAAGTRIIPMIPAVRNALKDQRELNMLLGRRGFAEIDGYTDFVFITKNHTPYCITNINFLLNNIIKAHNKTNELQLPHFSAHILRHTALTRLAESGIEPKALQTIAGHSSIQITMDIYVHLDSGHIAEQMQRAESIMEYKQVVSG